MKTLALVALVFATSAVMADFISLSGANVEIHARSSESVTGLQSNKINTALQPADTNEWVVTAHQNWLTNELDTAALTALHQFAATGKTTVVTDTFDPTVFTRWENGTGFVYRVTDTSHWNENGAYQPEITFPYPLAAYNDGVIVITVDGQYASVLIGSYSATAVPTNSTSFEAYYVASLDPLIFRTNLYEYVFTAETNSLAALATAADLLDVRSDLSGEISTASSISLASNAVTDAKIYALRLSPSASNLYANLAVTNVAGYAAFGTANPAEQQTMTVISAVKIATNTVSLRYDIGSEGFVSARAVTCARMASGLESAFSTLTLWNSFGEPLASNVFYGVWSGSGTTWPYFTNNLVWCGTLLTNAYLTLSCTMAKTNTLASAMWIASGGNTPSTLTVMTSPLPYATPDQLPRPKFYQSILEIPPVASGVASIIPLSDSRDIYLVQATNIQNSIQHRDLGLALTGRQAAWELWVNFTHPAGTNMIWCPCMRWDVIPDISVTGLYKFACSTIDGVSVQARQIYPIPSQWRLLPGSETGNASMGSGAFTIMADSATNDYLYTPTENPSKPILVKMSYYGSVIGVRTNAVTITPGIVISGVAEQWGNTVVATICTNSAGSQVISFLLPSIDSLCTGGSSSFAGWEGNFGTRYSLWFNRKSPGTGAVVSRALLFRALNELEIKAYGAGWRP